MNGYRNLSNSPLIGYAGYQIDVAVSWNYAHYRWYNPYTGQWVTEDPELLGPGPNPREYVNDAPTDGTDSTGLWEDSWWGGLKAADSLVYDYLDRKQAYTLYVTYDNRWFHEATTQESSVEQNANGSTHLNIWVGNDLSKEAALTYIRRVVRSQPGFKTYYWRGGGRQLEAQTTDFTKMARETEVEQARRSREAAQSPSFAESAQNVATGTVRGFKKAAKQTLYHPIDTLGGMANSMLHPVDSGYNAAMALSSGNTEVVGETLFYYLLTHGVTRGAAAIGDSVLPARVPNFGMLPEYDFGGRTFKPTLVPGAPVPAGGLRELSPKDIPEGARLQLNATAKVTEVVDTNGKVIGQLKLTAEEARAALAKRLSESMAPEVSEQESSAAIKSQPTHFAEPVEKLTAAEYLAKEETVLERPAVPRRETDINLENTKPVPPPAEIYVNGNPNILKGPGGRLGGKPGAGSAWQMEALKRDLKMAQNLAATDIRIRQTQVNAMGTQVGLNKPDLQYTVILDGRPRRVYIEYDNLRPPSQYRGYQHYDQLKANDPGGIVILRSE